MLTVLESLQLSTEYLEKKRIESARLNAELLLAEILNCKRLDLYLKFDQPLKENEVDKYRELISRRGKFEPLQYITGKAEFFGLTFKVNSSVLIPRPETELMVEAIIERFKSADGCRILDIGTGSGNISVTLAKFLENCSVTTIDTSEEIISLAKENAAQIGSSENINFIKADMNNYSTDGVPFDLIVSNPPYVSMADYSETQREIREFEPATAVTDFGDGLTFYKLISSRLNYILKTGGSIYLEVGMGQAAGVASILQERGVQKINFIKDYQQIDRIVYGELK
ncbi:MAG: peptide chain release factor N(5)-glutamine methyltransferase [Bacteroidota bacterium]